MYNFRVISSLYVLLFALVNYGSSHTFGVIDSPNVVFNNNHETLNSDDLSKLFSTIFGFTEVEDSKWKGYVAGNPFKRPESLTLFHISGLDDASKFSLGDKVYPLEINGDIDSEIQKVATRTSSKYPENDIVAPQLTPSNDLHYEKSTWPNLFKNIPADFSERVNSLKSDDSIKQAFADGTFNASNPNDVKCAVEIYTVKEFLKQVKSIQKKDGVPDIYYIKLSCLDFLTASQESRPAQVDAVIPMIDQLLKWGTDAMRSVYGDRTFVSVIVSESSVGKVRHVRSLQAAPVSDIKKWNLAYQWGEDFSIVFAEVLFVLLIIALTVFGVAVAMWNMDPGRDSIIYRMSMTRIKKD